MQKTSHKISFLTQLSAAYSLFHNLIIIRQDPKLWNIKLCLCIKGVPAVVHA